MLGKEVSRPTRPIRWRHCSTPGGSVPAGHCWVGYYNVIVFGNTTLAGNPGLGAGTSGAMLFTATDNCNNPIGSVFGGGIWTRTGKVIDVAAPILTGMQNLGVSLNAAGNNCVSNGWTAAN